jgi:lipopolysaccharide transport system ATP-binding protein
MKDFAIRVEGLSKKYQIGGVRESYKTLRDSLVGIVTNSIRRLRNRENTGHTLETIWALKDVFFEIKQSEIVGIIGPNGAGKSTLLKILSHITEPTEGRAVIRGRITYI